MISLRFAHKRDGKIIDFEHSELPAAVSENVWKMIIYVVNAFYMIRAVRRYVLCKCILIVLRSRYSSQYNMI